MSKMDIEKILQEGAAAYSKQAPTDAWQPIADALHKKKRRRVIFIWLFTSLFIGVAFWGSSAFLKNKNTIVENKPKKASIDVQNNNALSKIEMDKEDTSKKVLGIAISEKANVIELSNTTKSTFIDVINDKLKDGFYMDRKISKRTSNKNRTIVSSNKNTKIKETTIVNKSDGKGEESNAVVENVGNNDFKNNKETEIMVSTSSNVKDTSKMDKALNLKDSIANPIAANPIVNTKNKKIKSSIKKWDKWVQVSIGKNFINKNNLSIGSEIAMVNDNNLSGVGVVVVGATIPPKSNYTNGVTANTAFLLEKKLSKNFYIQFGTNINYLNFGAKAYLSTRVNTYYQGGVLVTDSTINSFFGNSTYAAIRNASSGSSTKNIKSSLLQIGFSIGGKIELLLLAKNTMLVLQTQLMPMLNLNSNISWYNKNSFRYFEDKKLISKIAVQQNIALLGQFKTKKNTFSIGPVYQFSWNKLNKTVNGLQNMTNSSLGIRLQYLLKN
jgi:hypothetical protein